MPEQSKLLAGYRQAIETTTRRGDCERHDWFVFEDKGERMIWCHPEERQAFIDAGIPESELVSVGSHEA